MSAEWAEMELGDFLELKRGYDLPKNSRNDGSVPIISSSGESGCHDVAKAIGPGVVTGRYGTIGEVYFVEEDYWPLNTTLYVRDFKGNNPLFVYYFLKTVSFNDYSDKAAVPGVNRNHLHKAKIRVPTDPEEQKDIALKLWALDQKIKLNHQINQTLELIAQAIFKSWFVDFEPVKAKIEAKAAGHDPERAAMCAISGKLEPELDQLPPEQRQQLAVTAALFPDELVESELGLIPEGWVVQRLENILDLSYGKSLTKTDRKDGDCPVYGSGGITGCHNKPLVSGPGIIVGRKGTVGALYWEDRDFFAIDTVFYVVPKNGANLDFLFYLLQTLGLENMNTDAAVPGLNRNNVYRLSVPNYSKELMEAFTETVGTVRGKVSCGLREIETLATLRDNLLPKLLSGELSVDECERQAEACA